MSRDYYIAFSVPSTRWHSGINLLPYQYQRPVKQGDLGLGDVASVAGECVGFASYGRTVSHSQ